MLILATVHSHPLRVCSASFCIKPCLSSISLHVSHLNSFDRDLSDPVVRAQERSLRPNTSHQKKFNQDSTDISRLEMTQM